MTLPALTRNYFTRGNAPLSSLTTSINVARSCVWAFKAHLCNNISTGTTGGTRAAGSVWTVVGSCNGTAAAMDGVDRWGTTFNAAALVYNYPGSNHSWIVLRNAALGYDICMDLGSPTPADINIIATPSSTPFVGGTAAYRPETPGNTEEFNIFNGATTGNWLSDVNTGGTVYSTFTTADNGEFWIAFHRVGRGYFHTSVMLWKGINGRAGDTRNIWWLRATQDANRGAFQLISGFSVSRRSYTNNPLSSGGLITPSFGGTTYVGTGTTDIETGEYMLIPTYLMQLGDSAQSVASLWCGQLSDIYWTGAATVGGSYPLIGTQTRVILGDFLVPSNTVNSIM